MDDAPEASRQRWSDEDPLKWPAAVGESLLADPAVRQLAWALGRVGWLLCLAAAGAAALALLPPVLADPSWWGRASIAIPAQAPLALLGLSLAHLAVLFEPEGPLLRRRLRRLRRAAALAALLLVLLIPVQLLPMFQPGAFEAAGDARQLEQRLERRFAALRAAVASAASVPELRERLQVLQGPPLDPRADSLPLPLVRRRLLLALKRSQPFVVERVKEGRSQRARGLGFLEGLRLALPTVLQALALASLSPLAPWTVPARWRPRGRAPGMARQGRRDLLRDLAAYGADEPLAQEAQQPTSQDIPPPSPH